MASQSRSLSVRFLFKFSVIPQDTVEILVLFINNDSDYVLKVLEAF